MPALFRNSRYMFFTIAALLFAAGIGWLLARHTLKGDSVEPLANGRTLSVTEKAKVHLYFGDVKGRYLRAEQRVLERPVNDAVFGRQLIDALIQGPRESGALTLAGGARLRAFFITDGTAYVDFIPEAFLTHPVGVKMELLTLYSIVNTLVVNVETIRKVKILIGGHEQPALAGHVDLQRSYMADMMWIR